MYKLKYYTLDKKARNKLKKEFYETESGKENKARLNRLIIIGLMGIIFSIYLFILPTTIWDIVTASILITASFIFIIASFILRLKDLNNYYIKRQKK